MYFHHIENNRVRGGGNGCKTNNSSVATNFNPLIALETYENNYPLEAGITYYINNGSG